MGGGWKRDFLMPLINNFNETRKNFHENYVVPSGLADTFINIFDVN